MTKLTSIALALSLLALAVPQVASAQTTRSRSAQFDLASGKYSVAYLHDGQDGNAGIVFNELGYSLPAKGLKLSALYVNSTGADARSYVGTYLSYRAYESKGVSLDLGIGLKGLDVTSLVSGSANVSGFNFGASRQVLFGVGLTFPLK